MATRSRLAAGVAALAVTALGLAGCGPVTSRQTVTVLGTWTGQEEEQFQQVLAPFEARTGIDVRFEGTRDFEAVLNGRIQSGDAPDLALMPSEGDLAQYAQDGRLIALDSLSPAVDVARLRHDYQPTWLRVGLVTGRDGRDRQYGIVVKGTRKSLVWYSKAHWKLPTPTTLEALVGESRRLAASGTPPWCVGLRSSSDSGWPGTDWIEDILLHQSGPGDYLDWSRGDLPWTSAQVRAAFTTWGELLGPGMVRLGAAGATLTPFGTAGRPMFYAKPGCYLTLSGSFSPSLYASSDREPPADAGHFDFPPASGGMVIAGDLLAVFRRTSASARLVDYLTGVDAQSIWARQGGTIAPNRAVGPTAYADVATADLAESVQRAPCADVVFDASDAMPATMRTEFYRAVVEFVADRSRLGTILAGLDAVRQIAYPKPAYSQSAGPPPPAAGCP